MAEFLDMGGYGAYIWSVYGLAAVIMIALLWHSIQKWRQNEAELQMLTVMNENKKLRADNITVSKPKKESA